MRSAKAKYGHGLDLQPPVVHEVSRPDVKELSKWGGEGTNVGAAIGGGSRQVKPRNSLIRVRFLRANRIAHCWRAVLNDELSRSRFIPVIERIVHVSGNTEPCEWRVETDRGTTQFVLKSEDDVRRLGAEQILILDARGQRYYIPDLRQLDPKNRRIVEWYV
jgi:hypothetical protein